MSSTPPPLPLQLAYRPCSPALASPRPSPAPSATQFNPFAPALPLPGSRSPLVRVKGVAVTSTAPEEMPKIRTTPKPFGEIGKDEQEWQAVDAEQEDKERSAFTPNTRTRERGRPMVRKSFQVRKKDDPATTALGRELGALELAKTELSQMKKEAEQEAIGPSPKEGSAEDSQMASEEAIGAAGRPQELPQSSEATPETVAEQ